MAEKFLKFIDAAKKGNLADFEIFYENEYLEKIDESGRQTIHFTIDGSNININLTGNAKGLRAIHCAAAGGHINILNKLIDCNCDIEAADHNGWRAIHWAADFGHINIINKLIDCNCDIEAKDNKGMRAIHWAAVRGHINIINKLIDCNCDKEAADNNGWRAIHHAADFGHINIINKLIDCNSDIEAKDNNGLRAIHWAAARGHMDIINKLINCNCDINPLTKDNQSVLDIARKNGKYDCVRLLERFLEDRQPQNSTRYPEEMICRVCEDKKVNCVFDCGHVFCMDCGRQVNSCPMCRAEPTNPRKLHL